MAAALPEIALSLTFPLWVAAAYFPCVLAHEVGHAVAGRLVGFRIAALGLGFGRPWLQLRAGGGGEVRTVFYLAGWVSGGLTVATHERLRPPAPAAALLAGGAVGNLVGAAVAVVLHRLGVRAEPVAALFYTSMLLVLVAAVPLRFKAGGKGGATFASDGWLALQALRGTLVQSSEPGPTLGLLRYCRDFSRQLDHPAAEAHFATFVALWELSVGDVDGAAETLASPCFEDPRRGDAGRPAEAYARAGLARLRGDPEVDARVVHALWVAGDDAIVPAGLALVAAQAALDRGARPAEAEEAVADAVDLARAAGAADLESAADALALEAAPPGDALDRCRALLARRGAVSLPPLARLRLLGATTRILAERGQAAEARALFHETNGELARLASAIGPARTRERFLERGARPLRAALAALGDGGPPIFVPEAPPPAPAPAARAGVTGCLRVTLVLAFLCLLALWTVLETGRCPSGTAPVVRPHPVEAARWEADLFRRHAAALRLMRRHAEAGRWELAAACIEEDAGGY